MSDLNDLTGRIALVTGADVAIHFHSQAPRADEVASEVEDLGRRTITTHGDLTRAADVARVAEDVARRLGPIGILVNNAGGLLGRHSVVEMTEDFFQSVMNVNALSTFLCTRAIAPGMIDRQGGALSLIHI